MKKIISSLLAVTLAVSSLAMTVCAAESTNSVNDNIATFALPSNPGVFTGKTFDWNSYMNTYSSESYWTFTLDKETKVKFNINGPTNKQITAVLYDENKVYDYDDSIETLLLSTTLQAGTYYVKLEAPVGLGEYPMQFYATKS